jgi:ParB/RepB/Spo0J family partition protein
MQLALFQDKTKTKEIVYLNPAELRLSDYNPRTTRPQDQIARLAERISTNGYEITRALWVYPNNSHVEVFAGGTRLEAAKLANLPEVPCVLHRGYTDEEIIHLAEQDNENDEYHAPVPIVDVWLSYKALADAGWTQEQIARAKGVARSLVSDRLQYAHLPRAVRDRFVEIPSLIESHAREISGLSKFDNLHPWLAREAAMLEIIEAVLKGDKDKITATTFKKKVGGYNQAIALVNQAIEGLPPTWARQLLHRLASRKARALSAIRDEIGSIHAAIAEEKRRQEEAALLAAKQAEGERIKAERAERIATARESWFAKNAMLRQGPLAEQGPYVADQSVDLIFTDPPYNEEAVPLYGELAEFGARVLKPGGSLICYAGHYAIPDICNLMREHLRYWWILCLEHTGGAARLPGKWVFVEWKPMLWFVKDNRASNEYVADRFVSTPPDKELHEWQQDLSEAVYYIEHLTDPGAVICDPFCGTGTTLLAGVQLGRRVIGIDADQEQIDRALDRLDEHYIKEIVYGSTA